MELMTCRDKTQELYNFNTDATGKIYLLMKDFNYLSFNECREELDCIVESLLAIPFEYIPPVEERNGIVELITEEYFSLFNEFPSSSVLSRLGDFLLLDYIKSRTKSKYDEDIFQTQKQLKRRYSRESMMEAEKLDFFNCKKNLNLSSLHKKAKKVVE